MRADFYKYCDYTPWHPIKVRTGKFGFELAEYDVVDELIKEFRKLSSIIAEDLPKEKVLLYAVLKYADTGRLLEVDRMLQVYDYKTYVSIVLASPICQRFYFVRGRKEIYENEE